MATQMQLEVILSRNPKEPIKTKTERGNCFYVRVVSNIKLRLIVMSTNLENTESRGTSHQSSILGDPGADSRGEGKSKRAEKYGTKKSKER